MTALHTLFGASALTLSLGLSLVTTAPFAATATTTGSASPSETVHTLAEQWAHTVYQQPESAHADQLKALFLQSRIALDTVQRDAELWTWSGIIAATYAGAKGGLGALKIAKRARSDLEAAMAIDPEALDGGARTSLGTLYYKVPGWPLGFGNRETAEELLRESADKHPENITAQYFYAEYLADQQRYDEAHDILSRAADIPVRDTASVADTGRQRQISDLLEHVAARAGTS